MRVGCNDMMLLSSLHIKIITKRNEFECEHGGLEGKRVWGWYKWACKQGAPLCLSNNVRDQN